MKNMLFLCVLSMLVSACGGSREDGASGEPVLLTTVGMLTDITRSVAGDAVRVEGLMGEGTDPHSFQPSASDVRKIQSASAILYVGHHLEERLTETFETLAGRGRPVLAVAERIDRERLLLDEEGNVDPHIWMDVILWRETAGEVAAFLTEWLPEHAETFQANLGVLEAELEALDAEIQQMTAALPAERRVLVTAHDAFGYFGARYGFEVEGIQGFSTDSEAGLRRMNHLVEMLVERGITAVFVESSVADRHVRALIEGAARRGHAVEVGGELFSDAMGARGTPEGTYAGMIRHNVSTIVGALEGPRP